MGTGKSSVGHLLASQLHFRLVDTDDLIEQQAGRKISEIFAELGEPRFRQLERAVVLGLAGRQRLVIATGGGVGANSDNLAALKKHALVVCLWAAPEFIWQRVRHQTHRPLLQSPDPLAKIQQLLAAREPFYRQADVLVNTDLRSVREVAGQVAHHFRLFHQFSCEDNHPEPGP